MTIPGLSGETWTKLTVPPLLDRLADLRDFVGRHALDAGMPPERVFDVKVAVSEAAANAIEHGAAENLKVYVRVRPDRMIVEVVGGGAFRLPEGAPRDRSHRGMGLPLMIAFADEVSVHRRAEGVMAVVLTFLLSREDEPAPSEPVRPDNLQGAKLGRLLSAVLERTPVAMYVLDAHLRFTWVNMAYRRFLDEPWRSGADVVGLPMAQVVPGSEDDGTLVLLDEVLEGGVPFVDDEYRYEGLGHGPMYSRWEILPFLTTGQGGKKDRSLLVVISDITEQVRARQQVEELAAEAERRAQEAEGAGRLLATLMECIPDGIAVVQSSDPDAPPMVSRYGRDLGRNPDAPTTTVPWDGTAPGWETYHADGLTPLLRPELPLRRAVFEGETVRDEEIVLRGSDGADISLLVSAGPIRDKEGKVVGGVASFHDVTSLKKGQEIIETQVREKEQRVGRQERLHEVSHRMLAENTVEGLLGRVVEASRVLTGSRIAISCHGFGEGRHDVGLVSRAEGMVADPGGDTFRPDAPGLHHEVLEKRALIRLSEKDLADKAADWGLPASYPLLGGMLGGPLLGAGGEATGFIIASGKEEGEYSAEDELLLGQLATLASLGLRQLDARLEAEGRASELAAVFDALTDAVSLWDAEGRLIRANAAAFDSVGGDTSGQHHDAILGFRPHARLDADTATPQAAPTQRALEGKTVADEAYRLRDRRGDERIYNVSAIPVWEEGAVVKAVTVWSDITAAIRERGLARALTAVNLAISSSLDRDSILRKVARMASAATGAESITIMLRSDEGWRLAYAHGFPETVLRDRLPEAQKPLCRLLTATRAMAVVPDVAGDARLGGETMEDLGIRSLVAAPLLSGGRVIGILGVNYHSRSHAFFPSELDFLDKLASSVSLALENARLYAAERRIAEGLQQSLLMIPEHIPGISFGHLYRSATEAAQVGGDFYDLFELPDDEVGILIGDVCGRGVQAARHSSFVDDTVRAYAYQLRPPNKVLEMANNAFLQRVGTDSFVTVFYGVFSTRTGLLRYSTAGHPPAVLRRENGEVRLLRSGSLPLGAWADASYPSFEEVLNEGDLLFLYTDGLTEARGDGGLFGERRLMTLIGAAGLLSPDQVSGAVFQEVSAFSNGRLADDLALLALGPADGTGAGRISKLPLR